MRFKVCSKPCKNVSEDERKSSQRRRDACVCARAWACVRALKISRRGQEKVAKQSEWRAAVRRRRSRMDEEVTDEGRVGLGFFFQLYFSFCGSRLLVQQSSGGRVCCRPPLTGKPAIAAPLPFSPT